MLPRRNIFRCCLRPRSTIFCWLRRRRSSGLFCCPCSTFFTACQESSAKHCQQPEDQQAYNNQEIHHSTPSTIRIPCPFVTWYPAQLVNMDRHTHAHTRQQRLAASSIERNDDRDALSHLRKVPARVVLGRQQRELAGGRHHDTLHLAGKAGIAVCIDMDIHILPDRNVTDGPFIYVGRHRLGAQVCHLKNR